MSDSVSAAGGAPDGDISLVGLRLQAEGVVDPPYAPEHSSRVLNERLLALVEVAEAARALIEDTKNGGQQELRREPCGDDGCGYSACALARALSKFSTSGGHGG